TAPHPHSRKSYFLPADRGEGDDHGTLGTGLLPKKEPCGKNKNRDPGKKGQSREEQQPYDFASQEHPVGSIPFTIDKYLESYLDSKKHCRSS
ncbi:MAG TPA: hypothetical protein PK468_10755, partial [Candidatus Hydrogenedentes bacterium]|nr:hypothetical protein [Candidatus Hydrogenedentota bacterium]